MFSSCCCALSLKAKSDSFLEKKVATVEEHASFGTKKDVLCLSWLSWALPARKFMLLSIVPHLTIMHLSQPVSLGYRKLSNTKPYKVT